DFFADANVRNAFVNAFEYENFLEEAFQGTAMQPNGPIPYGMFGYTPEDVVPNQTYDPQAAADFLDQTEYGTEGFEIVLYYNAGNSERELGCEMLAKNLEDLSDEGYIEGEIEVDIVTLDWPSYLDALYEGALPIFFLGWAPDYADPDDYVNPFLHSHGAFPYFLSLHNETLDEMIEEAAKQLDEDKRAAMYANITWACYNNSYYIWNSQAENFHVERAWVDGYYFNPMYSGQYYYELSKG
ncbi:MAG: ABC transporter substrate-binding protein, partial [Methanomassiliicoccales archaeon]